ncbi:MAG TPA: TolC family protein [Edaphocola sp.]|nr:TolC family protein [Edaphocola sp.]
MLKKAIFLFVLIGFLRGYQGYAQDTVAWTLPMCIQYALEHNLDLNQQVLNQRMAELQYDQNRLSQIPSVSLTGNYGKSYGRSVDPTSNQFVDADYSFAGANGNVDLLLFGWFSKRNSIRQDKLNFEAASADYEDLQDNIRLNVANGFLRILLAKEQVEISKEQAAFSLQQLQKTKAFVDAGRTSEQDLVQMEAQVASDSATYFSTLNDYQHAVLELKALLNLDMAQPLTIQEPQLDNISLDVLMHNMPEHIYEVAKSQFYSIKSSQLQVAAAERGLAAKKGQLYPQLSFGLQLGTNFSSTQKDITNPHITGFSPTGDFIDIAGNQYMVMQPQLGYDMMTTPLLDQLKNNFRQTAVLSLSVPIFNGWSGQTEVKKAKIDIQNKIIAEEKAEVKLKQDVYGAYYDAKAAAQKYYSARKAAQSSALALNYAKQRYQLGLLSTIDLLTTQNNTFKSESDAASAKYDLVFKLKVLDYYLGNTLKLK